jgi:hypothetical protein
MDVHTINDSHGPTSRLGVIGHRECVAVLGGLHRHRWGACYSRQARDVVNTADHGR